MRSFLLLISTFLLATIGFGIYYMMSGAEAPGPVASGPVAPTSSGPATLPTTSPTVVGPGEGAGWDKYDARTGQLTNRIRVQRYLQLKDGRLQVAWPRVDFFFKDGRVLRVMGESGTIVMQETVSKNRISTSGATLGQPRSGDLRNVTLQWLPSLDSRQPLLTMRMNNASFDNESFKIQTEAYRDADGGYVSGDQVPITVRGVDYDFDGQGLRVQYNELEQRLEYLRVAHGKRLVVKNPNMLRRPDRPAGGSLVPASVWAPGLPFDGIELAAAARMPVGAGVPATRGARNGRLPRAPRRPPTSRPRRQVEQPVYRATFQNEVKVSQGGRPLALAEELVVDFLSEEQSTDVLGTDPARSEARPPAPRAAAPRIAAERPAPTTRPAVRARARTRPAMPQSSEPIEILWSGPLVVIPLPGDRPDRIAPGQAIVKLTGSSSRPVQVQQVADGITTTLRCASLTHWTLDQGALLEEGPGVPVELTDTRGTKLLTHTMVYSQEDGSAVLYGKSTAKLPVQQPESRPGEAPAVQLMDVAWDDRCTLFFHGDGIEAMSIDRAQLQGNVAVKHPELDLNARTLDLLFANETTPASAPATRPASSSPQLKQLDANGQVKCIVRGPGGEKDRRSIDCDSLNLGTRQLPDGHLYANSIVAIGNVHFVDPEREMYSGYVSVALAPPQAKPTTRPSARQPVAPGELRSLLAHNEVRIRTADGNQAFADQLSIEARDGQTLVSLHGAPARVQRQKDTLSGPLITMVPETQHLTVIGNGELDATQQEAPDKPARPVKVTWTRSLDGQGDVVEVEGGVTARSTDPDGTINTATGQRVRLTMAPRPDAPATRPAAQTRPSTRPGELGAMANRVIQSITLSGQSEVLSVLTDKDGKLLRRFDVKSETIAFSQQQEKDKKLTIPGPGTLLFQDLRPPGTDPDARERALDPMGMRGSTAFKWEKQLVYDEKQSQLTMTGNVQVGRQEVQGEAHEPLSVFGDEIIADILPTEPGAGGAGAMSLGGVQTRMQLRKVRVVGHVEVHSSNLNVTAHTIEYDPSAHLLAIRGQDRQPAQQLDAKTGLATATFDEMIWNTQTNQVLKTTNPQLNQRK